MPIVCPFLRSAGLVGCVADAPTSPLPSAMYSYRAYSGAENTRNLHISIWYYYLCGDTCSGEQAEMLYTRRVTEPERARLELATYRIGSELNEAPNTHGICILIVARIHVSYTASICVNGGGRVAAPAMLVRPMHDTNGAPDIREGRI